MPTVTKCPLILKQGAIDTFSFGLSSIRPYVLPVFTPTNGHFQRLSSESFSNTIVVNRRMNEVRRQ